MADSSFTLFDGLPRFFMIAFPELLVRYLIIAGTAYLLRWVFGYHTKSSRIAVPRSVIGTGRSPS